MQRPDPIAQFPNPPLVAALALGAVARAAAGETARDAALLSHGALLIWATEEIVSGANWFRRLLGVAGGSYSLAVLARLRQG